MAKDYVFTLLISGENKRLRSIIPEPNEGSSTKLVGKEGTLDSLEEGCCCASGTGCFDLRQYGISIGSGQYLVPRGYWDGAYDSNCQNSGDNCGIEIDGYLRSQPFDSGCCRLCASAKVFDGAQIDNIGWIGTGLLEESFKPQGQCPNRFDTMQFQGDLVVKPEIVDLDKGKFYLKLPYYAKNDESCGPVGVWYAKIDWRTDFVRGNGIDGSPKGSGCAFIETTGIPPSGEYGWNIKDVKDIENTLPLIYDFTYENSSSSGNGSTCNGTNSNRQGGVIEGCFFVEIDDFDVKIKVDGNTETQNAGYDYAKLTLFKGPDRDQNYGSVEIVSTKENGLCVMEDKEDEKTITLPPGMYIYRLETDTRDGLWHTNMKHYFSIEEA